MSFFRKNILLLDLVNKFDTIENKIDILDTKFASLTFLDGCCDCKTRETHIFEEFKAFLDTKLLDFKNTILEICQTQKTTDTSFTSIIEDVYSQHISELDGILRKCCETHTINKTDLSREFKRFDTHFDNITSSIKHLQNNNVTNDLSLRTDLQTYLVGLQKNIEVGIDNQSLHIQQSIDNQSKNIQHSIEALHGPLADNLVTIENTLKALTLVSENIDTSVKGFYFDNKLIKHQLMMEEDMHKYSDEIEHVRILATKAKELIDNTLVALALPTDLHPELLHSPTHTSQN